MRIHTSLFVLFWTAQTVFAAITADSIKTSVDSFSLQFPFNPIKDLYWTGMKTHRRVCFAASPSGDAGYVAYLDASGKGVHVQQVNLQTFEAVGDAFTIPDGREGTSTTPSRNHSADGMQPAESLPKSRASLF